MTVIAIDGPGGSGKSTLAAAIATRLRLRHVDTGAYYRAATLAVLRAGADPADATACAAVVARAAIARRGGRTLLDGKDVEDVVRGPEVTAAVSTVSAHPAVRALLVERQRAEIGGDGDGSAGAIVEGRDAGTVVVPDADLKVWLTASPHERASRRAAQSGEVDPEAVALHAAALARRDALDAPQMVRAPDVVEVDTTGRSVAALVEVVVDLLARRGTGPGGSGVEQR